jgi:hypothetical protein
MIDFLVFWQLSILESVTFPGLLFVHFPSINNKSLIQIVTEKIISFNSKLTQFLIDKVTLMK